MKKAAKKSSQKASDPVVESLTQLLADSYALLGQTHVAHWNVEGPGFFELHQAFEAQYTELFAAIDVIAERIRVLGAYSPGGLNTLASLSSIKELPIKETPSKAYVEQLIKCHRIAMESATKTRDVSSKKGDPQTEDLAIARIRVHGKTIWMLESYHKGM